MNEIALRPSYWASVSGGKDSLYMLNLILHNLDEYPLDGVCHFELEIDYPFIHDVIDYMEDECKRFGIPFMRFKPRKTWEELYEKYGFPQEWLVGAIAFISSIAPNSWKSGLIHSDIIL